ncbi:MAG: hypothetical protein MUQ10_05145 [Anaerolineae bacterium]|nr:hypothetical protein [Anaerolineae bacterium]
MNLKRLVNLENLNWWLVLSGIGCNIILTSGVALLVNALGMQSETSTQGTMGTLVMMLGTFAATLITGFICGRMAQENETSYGVICCIGVAVIIVITIPPSIFTVMMLFIALAGGLNGGMLSVRRPRHNRH